MWTRMFQLGWLSTVAPKLEVRGHREQAVEEALRNATSDLRLVIKFFPQPWAIYVDVKLVAGRNWSCQEPSLWYREGSTFSGWQERGDYRYLHQDTELLVSPLTFISSSRIAPIHLSLLLHLMIIRAKLNVHFTLLYLWLVNSNFLTATIWGMKNRNITQ